MAKLVKHIYILVLMMLAWVPVSAQDVSSVEDSTSMDSRMDSIEISLLTCTPGKDMYAKFGPTALRVRDYTINRDVA